MMQQESQVIEAHATVAVLHDRIWELWRYRQWWRANRWADWPDLRHEHDIELRALVAVARKARDLSRPAIESLDAQAQALAYGDFYAYAS